MKLILLLALFYWASIAWGSPLSVDYLAVETSQFTANRDPYTPTTSQGEYLYRAALQWNVSVLGAAYWNNNTHTETTAAGVKTVGWLWEGGLHITPWLDIFKHHHSRHVVDEPSTVQWKDTAGRFPVEDSYGFRLVFIPNKAVYKGLLP